MSTTIIQQGGGTDLVIIILFTTRDLNGSRLEGFPYEGLLRGIEERFYVGRPCFLGVKHPLRVLSGEVLDDRDKCFRTDLVPEHTKLTISL